MRGNEKLLGMISIHAPIQGATHKNCEGWNDGKISIHAPIQGATTCLPRMSSAVTISIHAPIQGATNYGNQVRAFLSFQSTHLYKVRRLPEWIWETAQNISIHAPIQGATRIVAGAVKLV